jgi:dephospho-CoA kinase
MASYCIGLTGGIASGKTAVASAFQSLGIVAADADIAARDAVAVGSTGLSDVIAAFGEEVLDGNGALDRAAMRKRIFGNDSARRTLEAIIHPRVREALSQQCAQASSPYAIAAIPLLAEVGGRIAYPWLQRVLVIDVPAAVQHARLVQRDGVDAELANKMIAAQATREQRLAIADDIIINTGSLEELQRHVAALDARYRMLATFA